MSANIFAIIVLTKCQKYPPNVQDFFWTVQFFPKKKKTKPIIWYSLFSETAGLGTDSNIFDGDLPKNKKTPTKTNIATWRELLCAKENVLAMTLILNIN